MTRGGPTGRHALAHVGRWLLPAVLAVLATGCPGRPAPRPALHRVVIRGFRFEPASLTIASGDTVEWFNEHGGLTRENGDRFRAKLLSRGGSDEAMNLFRNFTGREPSIAPLLKRRGLEKSPGPGASPSPTP